MTGRCLDLLRCSAIASMLAGVAFGSVPGPELDVSWAGASLDVESAWIPLAPVGLKVHVGYMTIVNRAATDKHVLGADSPDYERVELHRSTIKDGVTSMEAVEEVRVPPHGRVEFAPTGLHFMLLGPKRPQALGARVPIVLLLSSGEKVDVSAIVRRRDDPAQGAHSHHWHICATCHSLDGISAMARFPKLAGQRAAYIEKQVRDFRDGRRNNDGGQMEASASDIADADLARTAAYFASLPPPPPDGTLQTNGPEWRRGAALYQEGDEAAGIPPCNRCHDDATSGQPQGPYLSSQHASYLAKQLRDWRTGIRTNSGDMPKIAAKLSDQDIDALATFLASYPRVHANGTAAQ